MWVVIGRGCLLDVFAMLMTLPYLLLLLVHSGKMLQVDFATERNLSFNAEKNSSDMPSFT